MHHADRRQAVPARSSTKAWNLCGRGVGLGIGALVALAGSPAAQGQVLPGDLSADLVQVASGLIAPALVTHAGDGSGRLFVVDQVGTIRIIQNGVLLATPFLDLKTSGDVVTVNPGYDERGMLGIAFHPNYKTNGRFFVRYSKARVGAAGQPCFGTSRGCHEEILAEYHVSLGNPNVADPTGVILFRVDKPQFNHDGGDVAFGPDGFLYFTLGDGGGANDGLADVPPSHGPFGNGQNIDVPLGKVLRIDVDHGSPYTIPADNPFVGGPGLDENYAYGFRNPYRFSFDNGPGGLGTLIVADVGQNLFEEIDLVTKGGNYGWVIREGKHCFDPFNPNTVPPPTCNTAGLIDPVAEYPHVDSTVPVGIAVVGGFVYRNPFPPIANGKYIFGDFSTSFSAPDGHLFYIDAAHDWSTIRRLRLGADNHNLSLYLKGMGRDEAGQLYVVTSSVLGPSGTQGKVWRIDVKCPSDFDRDGFVTGDDFDAYVLAFTLGSASADFDHDGFVTGDDFDAYVLAFEAGC